MAEVNKGGRPPKFSSVKKMQEKIDEYFAKCEGEVLKNGKNEPLLNKHGQAVIVGRKPPTMTGLALHLGFQSRQSLLNYESKDERFLDTITRACARVEQYTEEALFDKNTAAGAKFSLANNFKGWKERQDLEVTEHRKLEDML